MLTTANDAAGPVVKAAGGRGDGILGKLGKLYVLNPLGEVLGGHERRLDRYQ